MADEKQLTPKFCYACGAKLKRRYPGGDPENGPSRMACVDEGHVPLDDLLDEAESDVAEDLLATVVEVLEKHLETVSDLEDEKQQHMGFNALRAVRKDIIETLLEAPEEAYDAWRNDVAQYNEAEAFASMTPEERVRAQDAKNPLDAPVVKCREYQHRHTRNLGHVCEGWYMPNCEACHGTGVVEALGSGLRTPCPKGCAPDVAVLGNFGDAEE